MEELKIETDWFPVTVFQSLVYSVGYIVIKVDVGDEYFN